MGAEVSPISGNELVKCEECGEWSHGLPFHLAREHKMNRAEYLEKHPGAPLFSQDALGKMAKNQPKPQVVDPQVDIAGMVFDINLNVPLQDCLPLPQFYRVPKHGLLAEAIEDATVAMKYKRSIYVHGPPGSGKDAFFMAWSALTRTPALKFQVIPGTDIQPWFYSRALDKDGSLWEEGLLLRALRDGYELPDGTRVPYMILITDWDRATKHQAEWLRLVLDSIEGRIPGPQGVTYPIFPGTVVVATGNTAGGGDPRARMVSANPMDASIQERWERSFYFNWLDWRDEEPILRQKFPLIARRCPTWITKWVKNSTEVLRNEIGKDKLYMEFSHRSLCSWLGHSEDLLKAVPEDSKVPDDILRRGTTAFLTRIADPHTKQGAINSLNPNIPGGMTGGNKKRRSP